MKQPINAIECEIEDDEDQYFYVDVCEGFAQVEVAKGATKGAALKRAARRLRKLAEECEKMMEGES